MDMETDPIGQRVNLTQPLYFEKLGICPSVNDLRIFRRSACNLDIRRNVLIDDCPSSGFLGQQAA
jgi:hypothetical protein